VNLDLELAKPKEEITRMKMTTKQFPPSLKKGKLPFSYGEETRTISDIPEGIIAPLAMTCRGNLHDGTVVAVTAGSFESTIYKHNSDSKQVVDLEKASSYCIEYRKGSEDFPQAWNNWRLSEAKKLRPQGPEGPGLPSHFGGLAAAVGCQVDQR
jgi:hypothetical protein